MKKFILALLLAASPALAQSPVRQSGTVTPGHVPMWTTPGVIQDGGTAANGRLTGIGVTSQGSGICQNSAPTTGPYNQLCLGVNTASAATLTLQNFGGAAAQGMNFIINGTTYTFPFAGIGTGNVVGPNSSTAGHIALFNNTSGTLLSDTGNIIPGAVGISANSGTLPSGPAGTLFQIGNANNTATVAVLDSFGAAATTIPVWNMRRARGTAAVPSAVANLDTLGAIAAMGYGTTGYSLGGSQFRFVAAETFTDAAQGSFISAFTTATGSSAAAFVERLRIGASNTGVAGTSTTLFGTGVITASGNNTIAIPAGPAGTLFQIANADATNTIAVLDSFGTTAFSAWDLRKARGTTAVPSAVQFLDNLGIIGAMGYGTTGYSLAGSQIRFVAGDNFTDAVQGSFVSLRTTPAGAVAGAGTERLRVGADAAATAGAYNVLFGLTLATSTDNFGAGTNSTDSVLVLSKNTSALPLHDPAVSASEQWPLQIGLPDSAPGGMGIDTFDNFGVVDFRRFNGTAASRSALVNGDFIGVVGFLGATSTTANSGGAAQMRGYAAGNWSPSSTPSRLVFITTPSGSDAFTGYTQRLLIDSTGYVGIGGAAAASNAVIPDSLFTVNAGTAATATPASGTVTHVIGANASNAVILIDSFGTGTTTALSAITLRRADGTSAVPSAVQLNDVIGVVSAQGYGTSQYSNGAGQIRFVASEVYTNTATGQAITFTTTASTTTIQTEAGRFTPLGGLAVGLTADTTAGVINALTGFRINSAATSGNVLRGNGTNFVSAALAYTDLTTGAATVTTASGTGLFTARSATATPAAASAVSGFCMGSASICLYWGTGTPNTVVTAAKGSLYIQTDGSSSSTRMFINTDGSTAWAAVTTAS